MTPAQLLSARWEQPGILLDFAKKYMCQVPGCTTLRRSISFCMAHDMRFLKEGGVQAERPIGAYNRRSAWIDPIKAILSDEWTTIPALAKALGTTPPVVYWLVSKRRFPFEMRAAPHKTTPGAKYEIRKPSDAQ